ncbi:hypothetical protein IAR50_003151 [Cryptococcus sp. DSM 104548]
MQRGETYQPNWSVRAVTVPGPDTDLCLHVAFDNAKFIFGAGEGTQRAFAQKKIGFGRLAGVFVNSGESKGRGGLPGLIMSAADAGIKAIDVIGPPDISQYIGSLRSSVIRDSFTLNPSPYPRNAQPGTPVNLFTSPNMTVRSIALFPPPPARQWSAPVYEPYTPLGPVFRPSRLAPDDLQKWCHQVVSDMFQNNTTARLSQRAPSPPPEYTALSPSAKMKSQWASTNVFLGQDGTINAARPDTRAALPTPSDTDVHTQMVYIIETPEVRGKFDSRKAKELGVPNGPIRGQLTRGEVVEFPDPEMEGVLKTVRPEECLIGGGPGAVMILVNCTLKTLPELLHNKTFAEYQPGREEPGQSARKVHLIVHHIPRQVLEDERYREWMRAFGEETQHLIADTAPVHPQTAFNSAAWVTLNLSHLDPSIFHPPLLHRTPSSSLTSPSLFGFSDLPPKSRILEPNDFCRMHPRSEVGVLPRHEKDVPFTVGPEEAVQKAKERVEEHYPEYAEACKKAQEAVRADPRSNEQVGGEPGDDLIITTLGTGSAIPSKYRNVSSTLLTIPASPASPSQSILLDAGEGTLGQLRRRFGKDGELEGVLRDLAAVFVSHMHADHHLGVNSILEERFRMGITTPLYVIAPQLIALNMKETATWQSPASEEGLRNVKFISIERLGENVGLGDDLKIVGRSNTCSHPTSPLAKSPSTRSESPTRITKRDRERSASLERRQKENEERRWERDGGAKRWPFESTFGTSAALATSQHSNIQSFLSSLSLTSLHAPRVWHRGRAFGLVLEHSSGWKLVYSGDTKPCTPLVEAGKGATVLIHEATLEDDKPEVAAMKGHSTFGQAVDVGKQMGAKYILLNHFSQRYPKLPKMTGAAPALNETSESAGVIAEDNSAEETVEEAPAEDVQTSLNETVPDNVVLGTPATVDQPFVLDATPALPNVPPAPLPTSTALPSSPPPHISISFDFMSIRLSDMWKMPYYMDALSILFAEPEEADAEDGTSGTAEGKVDGTGEGAIATGTGEKAKGKKAEKREKKQAEKEAGSEGKGPAQGGEFKSKRALKKELAMAQKEKEARKVNEIRRKSLVGEAIVVEEEGLNVVNAQEVGTMEVEGKGIQEAREKRAGSPGIEEPEAKRRSVEDQ